MTAGSSGRGGALEGEDELEAEVGLAEKGDEIQCEGELEGEDEGALEGVDKGALEGGGSGHA